MMNIFASILLVLSFFLRGAHFPLAVVPLLGKAGQQVCENALAELLANPGWISELRDPILSSPEEIRDRVTRYGVLYRCMATGSIPVTGDQAEVYHLATLFMLLTGGTLFPEAQAEAKNYTLTFADLQDTAVLALRDDLGIPSPPGYIYIWLYPSRADLPKALSEYVSDSSIRGLTLQSRYIIVFDEVRAGEPLTDYLRDQRSATLSHEFVHAYIKSYLGPERGFSLPAWFDEGLAIYLSGSSEPSSASYYDADGRQVTWSVPPKDYARYRDDFNYLEQFYGRERFMQIISRAILENDPGLLYREAGLANEDEVFRQAEAVRVRRGLTRLGLFVGLPAAAIISLVLVNVLRKKRAERHWRLPDHSVPPHLPAAAPALPVDGSTQDISGLISQLSRHEEPDSESAMRTRYFAAQSLARMDSLPVVDALLGVLTDEAALVRAGAARALGKWAARMARAGRLDSPTRARILAGLFPLLSRDQANESRWAAAEALYDAGGEAVLRPILAAVRRWSREEHASAPGLHQGWLVGWAAAVGLTGVLIEAYPWCVEAARQSIITYLRGLPEKDRAACLELARQSGDPRLGDLVETLSRHA